MTAGRINQIRRLFRQLATLLGVTPFHCPPRREGRGPLAKSTQDTRHSRVLRHRVFPPRRGVVARSDSFGWPLFLLFGHVGPAQHTGSPIRRTAPDHRGSPRAVGSSIGFFLGCVLQSSGMRTGSIGLRSVSLARGYHSTVTPLPGLGPL